MQAPKRSILKVLIKNQRFNEMFKTKQPNQGFYDS